MPVSLADPKKLEELSQMVESVELDASLESFIRSLSLPDEEEDVVRQSMKMLPQLGSRPTALPKNPPNLIRMDVWK
jgi:hypothetical protein